MNTKFQGYAVLNPKQKLEKWEYSPPDLGRNDVEIDVTHNGLCHSDLHMRDNDWGITTYPLVAGHEVVGIVTQLGADVTKFKIGDRLGFGWISNSCRVCEPCLRGEENICYEGSEGLIVGNHGGFANKLRACADFAYTIPESLDSASAAPLLCAGITVYSPLRKHITKPGMKVGVIGIGGLGHLGIKFARAMGAQVTAFSTSDSKEKEAKEFGAHYFCNWQNPEDVNKLLSSQDLILSTVSSEIDWEKCLSLLRNNGVFCLLGAPISMLNIPLTSILFGQKTITSSVVGGRSLMTEMLNFAALHQIKPMIETMPIFQVNEAMDKILANKARYRIVLVS
jgi:alcohol/geraniol dehydrogenase (NADP+)